MSDSLSKYIRYIRNTAQVPLSDAMFDEDWEPIGPMVRRDLVAAGLVTDSDDGLRVVESPEP